MKPKKQTFTDDSYVQNLSEWISAIAEIPFAHKAVFKTYSATKEKIGSEIAIDTDLFDDQFTGTGNKAIFIAEILPVSGKQDFDGIFATFESNNQAFFEDMDYGNYKEYFEANGIIEGEKMTWQEAYDKLCELAKKEQVEIPKFAK